MAMRVFVLTVPHASGDVDLSGCITQVYPVASGALSTNDGAADLRPYTFLDMQFQDGSTGLGVQWTLPDPNSCAIEAICEPDLLQAWVHGALAQQSDPQSFWLDVVDDLVNNVTATVPISGNVDARADLRRALFTTLRQRLGLPIEYPDRSIEPESERSP